jgi:plastocyanin
MRLRARTTVVLAAVLSLLLVACPADDPDDEPADGIAGDGETVTISGFEFEPASLTVEAGASVSFVNEDSVVHTVTAGSPDEQTGEFDESLSEGDEATIVFDEAGTFPYFCQVHPTMTGEVQVGSDG